MAEDVVKQVRVQVAAVGADTAKADIEALKDRLDELYRQGDLTEKQVADLNGEINSNSAVSRNAAREVARYAEGFGDLVKWANKASQEVRKFGQESVVAGSNTPKADAALDMSLADARQILAIDQARKLTAVQVAQEVVKQAEAYEKAALAAVGGRNYSNVSTVADDAIAARRKESAAFAQAIQTRMQAEQTWLTESGKALDANMAAQGRNAQAVMRTSAAVDSMATGSLPRLRYALYDVSTTLAIAGAGMVALSAATAGVAIRMDRQFADVVRTSGTYLDETGKQTANLRHEFDSLFSSLPASWADLTEIGTLAGQLGVAQENIAEFTSLVAKFASVTDVSVEQSATAFGRLSELLNVPAQEYENLGSSILKVGVNSVATESQIIAISSQIASMGDFAGMSADEVIGLSAAMASLGIQPELSRGVITRLFTNITKSVAEGGVALENFGAVSGQSGAEFAQAWGDDATSALFDLLSGLGGIEDSQAVQTLNTLGITASRDIPTILKLAQNTGVLRSALDDASSGYADGSALQEQYGVIAETVSAKLEILRNNFQLFVAALGGASDVLGPVIDGLTVLVQGMTSLAGNQVVQTIGLVVLGLTALGGLLALAAGGAARMAGSFLAVRQAVFEASVAMGSMASVTAATEAGFTKAAFAIKGFRTALISTGIGAALAAAGTALAYFVGQADQAEQANEELAQSFDRVTGAITQNTREIAFKSLVDSGAVEAAKTLGISLDTLTDAWLGDKSAIEAVASATSAASEEYEGWTNASGAVTQAAIDNWDAINLVNDSIGKGNEAMSDAQSYARDQAEAMREGGDSAAETAAQFELAEESATSLADGLFDLINAEIGMIDATYNLGASLAENGLAFDTFSVGGRANIQALQEAITAAATNAGGDADLFSSYVQQIIADLVAAGAVGVQQLAFVQSALGAGNPNPTTNAVAAVQLTGQLAQGYNSVANAANKAGNAGSSGSRKAAKEVRTLTDYVSDLSKVFSDAFDFRFGLDRAFDDVQSSIQSIADGFEDARIRVRDTRDEIRDLQADLLGLKADQSVLTYQLSVATEYGDALRAQQIQADLAKIGADLDKKQADLTDTQKELTKAQEESTPTLEGNTEAAREQRAAVLDLLESYQKQVEAYAATGASQEEVRQYAARLKGEFEAQMRQLGYNTTEIQKYSRSFDDLVKIIATVPRNLTVNVNADTSPADKALSEYISRARSQAGSSGINIPITTSFDQGAAAKFARLQQLLALIEKERATMNYYIRLGADNQATRSLDRINEWTNRINSGNYYSGGYTGPGGMYEPAGIVHRGEYVIPKKDVNQRTGLPYADAMSRLQRGTPGRMGYANGGTVTGGNMMIVELGPKSLRAVQEGAQVNLFVDSQKLAGAVNNANAVATGVRGIG